MTPRCCRRCCIHTYTHTYIHACKHAYIPWTGQDQSPRRCPGYILASGSTLALLPRLRDLAQRCSSDRGCGAVEAAEEAATAAPRGSGHRSYPFREHGAAPGPEMIDRSATRGCPPQALGGTLLQRPQRMHLDGDGYAALRPQKTLDVVVLRRHIVPAASTWPLLLFRRPASHSPLHRLNLGRCSFRVNLPAPYSSNSAAMFVPALSFPGFLRCAVVRGSWSCNSFRDRRQLRVKCSCAAESCWESCKRLEVGEAGSGSSAAVRRNHAGNHANAVAKAVLSPAAAVAVSQQRAGVQVFQLWRGHNDKRAPRISGSSGTIISKPVARARES